MKIQVLASHRHNNVGEVTPHTGTTMWARLNPGPGFTQAQQCGRGYPHTGTTMSARLPPTQAQQCGRGYPPPHTHTQQCGRG